MFQFCLLSPNVNRRILLLRLQNQATELELRLSKLATIFLLSYVSLHLNGGLGEGTLGCAGSVCPVVPTSFSLPPMRLEPQVAIQMHTRDFPMNANLDQRHFSIKSALSKTQRRYTIGYQPKRGDCTTPAIHLSGKWLREAGFDTGTVITVKIEQGCLLLIPESAQM